MRSILTYLEDRLLKRLQSRCRHEGGFVAADILEGSGDGLEVKYCRRCGAFWINYEHWHWESGIPTDLWRIPDPMLWRG